MSSRLPLSGLRPLLTRIVAIQLLGALLGMICQGGVAWAQSGDSADYAQGRHGDGHAEMHEKYKLWKTHMGYSCCDDGDCRPTRAWQDMEGHWWAIGDGRKVEVPPDAVLNIPSPDGRSHICMSKGAQEPRCFIPGEVRG